MKRRLLGNMAHNLFGPKKYNKNALRRSEATMVELDMYIAKIMRLKAILLEHYFIGYSKSNGNILKLSFIFIHCNVWNRNNGLQLFQYSISKNGDSQDFFCVAPVLKLKLWDTLYFQVLAVTRQRGVSCELRSLEKYIPGTFSTQHINWKQLQ